MRPGVLISGPDLPSLFALSMQLGPIAPTVIEAKRPIESLSRRHVQADAAVVWLDGSENVAELRRLFDVYAGTRFVLLARSLPPHAAVARIVTEHGGAVLSMEEPSVLIAATLVAMLSQSKEPVL